MAIGGRDDGSESLGALVTRLIEDSSQLLRAELDLYRKSAVRRLTRSRSAVIAGAIALLLVQGAIVALFVGFALGLGRWLGGPAGGGLAVFIIAMFAAVLLLRFARRRMTEATALLRRDDDPPAGLSGGGA